MPPPTSVVRALKPSLFQTWSAPALVIVLLLLSTRDCAKSLVSRAGTVSRVHVSSRSGGWVCRPAAKTGRERGEEVGEEEEREEGTGREEGEEESLSAESRQAGRQRAGWLRLHVRGRLSSCREEHCLKQGGLGVVLRRNRAFPTWFDIPKQRRVYSLSMALIVDIWWLTVILWWAFYGVSCRSYVAYCTTEM